MILAYHNQCLRFIEEGKSENFVKIICLFHQQPTIPLLIFYFFLPSSIKKTYEIHYSHGHYNRSGPVWEESLSILAWNGYFTAIQTQVIIQFLFLLHLFSMTNTKENVFR